MSKLTRCVGGVGVVGAVVAVRPGTRANRYLRHQMEAASRRARYFAGRMQGAAYEAGGNHPDPNVDDLTLADRIRSSIGSLIQELDIPHVHVMVEHHVALLHGEVAKPSDVSRIEAAVAKVAGVIGVESYLHVGLLASDTRPSEGAVATDSEAFKTLVRAAEAAGVAPGHAPILVQGTLATFAELIPDDERDHVRSHLPADVAPMFEPARRTLGAALRKPRTVDEFVHRMLTQDGDSATDAPRVARAVIAALHDLVKDEQADVAAVLPPELRDLWHSADSASSTPVTAEP